MDNFLGNVNDRGELFLNKEEVAHCFRVLRKKEGDKIGVLNGKGDYWIATLTAKTSQTGLLLINSQISQSIIDSYSLHIAIAPTKSSDRIEWFLEKAIETGLHKLSLIYTQRTERKKTNLERLEKIATSAMKQSGQLHLPEINEGKFKDFLKTCQAKNKYIASCKHLDGIISLKELSSSKDICVLIGPEGDFTDEEYELALSNGFTPLSLGKQRFRTETAALLVVMAKFSLEEFQ